MKPQETKLNFIQLRAEGKSYSYIADKLHISKATCTSWEQELKNIIMDLKQEQLEELYNTYYITKEARIKRLGDTLTKINEALQEVDYKSIPPERLLDYKLKYMEALKEEYTGTQKAYQFTETVEAKDIVEALGDLLNRVRAGEITTDQATRENLILTNLLKAFETVETQAKIEALESFIGGR